MRCGVKWDKEGKGCCELVRGWGEECEKSGMVRCEEGGDEVK